MLLGKVIMLQRQPEFNHFRLTTIEDIKYLAPRLRKADKQEILASTGFLPYEALHFSFLCSTMCFTIVNNKNIPVAIFGVTDCKENVGGIWAMATNELEKIKLSFLKECKAVIELLNKKYKILWNFVDCRNELHIKWLKWCGFTFLNKQKYGVLNKPFYEFIRICA
jgi:hypothetical protein